MHTFLVVCIFLYLRTPLAYGNIHIRIPPKLQQKNVAYGNKNKFFLHIYIFFCIFAVDIEEVWVEI